MNEFPLCQKRVFEHTENARHFPVMQKKWNKKLKKLAIVYPNESYGGAYNLGVLIIYNIVNSRDDWICERRFIDAVDLASFDLIGFSWQYELDLYNIIDLIEKNEIKGKIFAGGPCVNNNHKPLDKYVNFFVLGSVEDLLEKILDEFDSANFLENISAIDGVFVPGISKTENYAVVSQEKMNNFYPLYQPLPLRLDKNYVFGNCFLLEVERGCPFKCKFCPLGVQGIVYRNLEFIKKIIDDGIKINNRKKVIIYTDSFTHPKRKEILQYLLDKGLEFSVPSIKVEYMNDEVLELIRKGGQRTLTIAPECGESYRMGVGKDVKDSVYENFARIASRIGFREIKMYFIIGLPGQDVSDLDEMIAFVSKMKKAFSGKLYVSVNPLMPKARTVYENVSMDRKKIESQIKYLRKNIKVRVKFAAVETSIKCWRIGLGGIKFSLDEIYNKREKFRLGNVSYSD